jgi:hypothetical protein
MLWFMISHQLTWNRRFRSVSPTFTKPCPQMYFFSACGLGCVHNSGSHKRNNHQIQTSLVYCGKIDSEINFKKHYHSTWFMEVTKSVSYGNILPFLPTEIDSMIKSYDNPIFLHLLDMGVYYTVLHSAHMVREVIHLSFRMLVTWLNLLTTQENIVSNISILFFY